MKGREMKPTRFKSFRITEEVDGMIHELSIKLNISHSEVLRYAIKAFYALHFK